MSKFTLVNRETILVAAMAAGTQLGEAGMDSPTEPDTVNPTLLERTEVD